MSTSASDIGGSPPAGDDGGNSDGFWVTIIVIIVVLALILLSLMLFVFYYKLRQRDKEMAKELEERDKKWEERLKREEAARKYAEKPTASTSTSSAKTPRSKSRKDHTAVNVNEDADKKGQQHQTPRSNNNSTAPNQKKKVEASDSTKELPAFSNIAEASPPTSHDEDRHMMSSQLSSSLEKPPAGERNRDLKAHQPPALSTPAGKGSLTGGDRRLSLQSTTSRRSSQQSQQSGATAATPAAKTPAGSGTLGVLGQQHSTAKPTSSVQSPRLISSNTHAAAGEDIGKTSLMSAASVKTSATVDSEASGTTVASSSVVQTPQSRKAKPTLATFKKGKLLGSGAFGRVYMGLDETTGGFVAAKEVSFSDFDQPDMMSASQGGSGGTEKRIKALAKEIAVMKRLSHANIVNYLGADRKGTDFYIFMEYLPGGSLRGTIDSFGKLAPRLCTLYLKQALRGLSYLHSQQVVHRDVKAANMLLDKNGCVKLADFGCSQSFESIESMRGTPYWLAPEVVRSERGIGAPSDIWSIGCVLMEMLTGQTPWYWLGNAFAVMNAVAGAGTKLQQGLENMPDEINAVPWACDFIQQCCSPESTARPTANDLLEHPLVTGFANSSRRPSEVPIPGVGGLDDPIDTPQQSKVYDE